MGELEIPSPYWVHTLHRSEQGAGVTEEKTLQNAGAQEPAAPKPNPTNAASLAFHSPLHLAPSMVHINGLLGEFTLGSCP